MSKFSHLDWQAPSGVDIAVTSHFCGPFQRNLVLARASLLQIFVLREDVEATATLSLLREINLKGNIQSIVSVRLPGRASDSLLLSFDEARASVLHWDHELHDIRVDSLHYYENDEQLRDGHNRVIFPPKLVASDSCATMVVYDSFLAVMPLLRLPIAEGRQYTEEYIIVFISELGELSCEGIWKDKLESNRSGELMKRFPSSYTIPLKALGDDVKNVRDICFLERFNLPTLLILYEPFPTAFNRTAEKTLTCRCLAITLDIANRQHSIAWKRDSIPYDAHSISPVPAPLGGVVVLSPNAFLYLSSSAEVGLTLNHFGDRLPYKFKTYKSGRVLSLDAPRLAWIGPSRAMVNSKDGSMTVFDIVNDGTTVSAIRCFPAGTSVAATCLAVVKSGPDSSGVGALIFAASRVDDSVLLQVERKPLPPGGLDEVVTTPMEVEIDAMDEVEDGEPPPKKPKIEGEFEADADAEAAQLQVIGDSIVADPIVLTEQNPSSALSAWESIDQLELTKDDLDLLDFFKERAWEREQADLKEEFVCVEVDRLLCVGPAADVIAIPSFDEASLSKIDATDKKEFQKQSRKLVDLVMSVGSEQSGALIAAQQSLRPNIRVNFAVPGLEAVWALKYQDNEFHRYVLLSRNDSTLVLESGESLQEITNDAEYITDAPTIAAGTVLHNSLVAQVHPKGVLLLDGAERVAEWVVTDKASGVKRAQILDPFIVVQLQNSAIILIEARMQIGEARFAVCNVALNDTGFLVTAFSIFKDTSRRAMFNYSKGQETISHKRKHPALSGSVPELNFDPSDNRALDPEERELYGSNVLAADDDADLLDVQLLSETEVQRPYYLVFALETGAMQIVRFTATAADQVFVVNQFSNFPTVLANEMEKSLETKSSSQVLEAPSIVEVCMTSIGDSYHAPHLFALSEDGTLAVYECFAFPAVAHQSLPLRLRRIEAPILHNIKPNVRDFPQFRDPAENFAVLSPHRTEPPSIFRARLTPFENIGDGHRGVFISGERSYWAFSERETLRFYPMTTEGHVNAFSSFHNSSNENGFIFHCASEGKVKIATLPKDARFGLSLITRRIPLGRTIHSIVFDAPTNLLAVMTSYKVIETSHYYQVDLANNASAEDPKAETSITDVPLPDRLPDLPEERFEMYLVNPEDWRILDKFLLEEEEHVLSMRVVHLKVKEGEKFVMEPLIALGTAHVRGEDQPVLGNIRLIDVLRPQDTAASRLNVVVTAEQRGPVASVGHVEGVLIACIGMKVLLFSFLSRTELVGCAFFDCQIQIVNAIALKNYILLADVLKSIYFLRWREDTKQLELLGKDYDARSVFTTDFLVDGDKLSFLVTDDERNVHVFKYDPLDNESRGGQKLICTGNYHLGTHVNRMVRVKTNVLKTNRQVPIARYCNIFATVDGGIGSFIPISDEAFDKFGRLEMRMVSALPQPCGLNPKAFRLSRSWQSLTQNRVRSVIDMSLLKRFASLDRGTQKHLASLVGLSVDQVLDFILDIDMRVLLF